MANNLTARDYRLAAIKRLAAQYKEQPLHPYFIKREIFTRSGILTTEATIKRDLRALLAASPSKYYLRHGVFYRAATDAKGA